MGGYSHRSATGAALAELRRIACPSLGSSPPANYNQLLHNIYFLRSGPIDHPKCNWRACTRWLIIFVKQLLVLSRPFARACAYKYRTRLRCHDRPNANAMWTATRSMDCRGIGSQSITIKYLCMTPKHNINLYRRQRTNELTHSRFG